jgi:hypothetical protein
VRAHVTGTIIDYGPDEEKGTADDVTYTIDQLSDWLEADLTIYTVTLGVRRTGSGAAYGSSATVAAGGVDSDVHKADIEVATSPAVASVTLDIVVGKKTGEGEGQPDTGGAASVSMSSYTTDANGKAYGTFTSSNKIESVTIECQDGSGSPLPGAGTATVNQGWDSDSSNNWVYEPYFWPEVWEDVSFTCKLTDGASTVPITGHSFDFYAYKVIYYEWDEEAQDYVQYEEVISEDNDWDLSWACEFEEAEEAQGGVYETRQIVHEDSEWYWFVDEVSFWAIDETVFE